MKILFLTTAHNTLSQRLQIELEERGHQVSIELALDDAVMQEAVELWRPELILCPFLKRAVPETIWSRYPTLIVHPGIRGDRGAYSLDHAIMQAQPVWGVTLLQANAEMDAGDIWAWREFPMREASKSSIYQNEVVEAAVACVLEALERFPAWQAGVWKPTPLAEVQEARGVLHPVLKQKDRAIDWGRMPTKEILRRIRAADGSPGVLDEVLGMPVYLFGAHAQPGVEVGLPGEVLGQREGAILRKTVDGAIWISHLKAKGGIKLPAVQVLGERAQTLPVWGDEFNGANYQEIRYWEESLEVEGLVQTVGHLAWEFQGGGMRTEQARALQKKLQEAARRPTAALVLWGGYDVFSNGIHLGAIEAAADPALASWENINAINDVVHTILTMPKLTVSAVRGHAGAGGAVLALAADRVYLRDGVVLNPHYKGMGLYGSEYWTYLLPRRVGWKKALELTESLKPLGAQQALRIGLVEGVLHASRALFEEELRQLLQEALEPWRLVRLLHDKAALRQADEGKKPLEQHRQEELAQMARCFWGEGTYHAARRAFVYKQPPAQTPAHLALHRRLEVLAP